MINPYISQNMGITSIMKEKVRHPRTILCWKGVQKSKKRNDLSFSLYSFCKHHKFKVNGSPQTYSTSCQRHTSFSISLHLFAISWMKKFSWLTCLGVQPNVAMWHRTLLFLHIRAWKANHPCMQHLYVFVCICTFNLAHRSASPADQ